MLNHGRLPPRQMYESHLKWIRYEHTSNISQIDCIYMGVDGADQSPASKRTRRNRAAHDAAVAILDFLGISSSHLMLPSKKTN
ncbi:hypothetical protein Y032_0030g2075 [Ancylostoma ceylanicum]|uniref:Uncharacterized protein n=1 Tax=Ancylostoma ceylanicum TaxID=53326 RepID=A0A016USM7_9BILA|nr:hypothetical protein Y032_0030g2075 [Ancylostoma ceylanicum]